mgnify:CR=1 FL=1
MFDFILDLYISITCVLVRSEFSSFFKNLLTSGETLASWRITEIIDSGSNFNSLNQTKLAIAVPLQFLE